MTVRDLIEILQQCPEPSRDVRVMACGEELEIDDVTEGREHVLVYVGTETA